MSVIRFLAALALAVALHAAGARVLPSFPVLVDLFLMVTLTIARRGRPLGALAGGVAAGWAADALSGAPFGLNGLADSAVGYATAQVAQRLVVDQPGSLVALYAAGAAAQGVLLAALGWLVLPAAATPSATALGARIVTTTLAGFAWTRLERRWSTRRRRRGKSGSLEVPKSLLR